MFLNIATGEAKQCYKSFYTQNIYKDLSKPIVFKPIGNCCLSPHCFNSHALMTLGLIPEIDTPNYSEMRNRITINGSEWLKPEIKQIMSEKLYDDNVILGKREEKTRNIINTVEAPLGMCKQLVLKLQKKK